jgi:GNAT superfamily N-acetyltransferase
MPVSRRRECADVLQTLRERHPSILVGAREDTRSITLDRLIVPSGSRGRGLGSALMRDLVAYADRQGKQVRLTPSGAFGGAPRRLARFYARFGFVPNEGTRRDPACRESMYRNPATGRGRVRGRRA